MAGLGPAIHAFLLLQRKLVDGPNKSGHDESHYYVILDMPRTIRIVPKTRKISPTGYGAMTLIVGKLS
jgi:hypothetical protein